MWWRGWDASRQGALDPSFPLSFQIKHDVLDWHGDHPHTNLYGALNALRGAGYAVDLLGSPATCFNASYYGALLIVDSENEFYDAEIDKLEADVKERGLGLVIFADWFNAATAASLRFFDDNTRSWWTPPVGGANVPALNDLLGRFGAAFGDAVLEGSVAGLAPAQFQFASGANLARAPAGAILHRLPLVDEAVEGVARGSGEARPALSLFKAGAGALALFGDSACVDTSHQRGDCHDMLLKMVAYAAGRGDESGAGALAASGERLAHALDDAPHGLPARLANLPPLEALPFTGITDRGAPAAACGPDAPLEFGGGGGVVGGVAGGHARATPAATPAPIEAEPVAAVPRRSSYAVPAAAEDEEGVDAATASARPPPSRRPPPHVSAADVAAAVASNPAALAGVAALAVGGVWVARARARRAAAAGLPRTAGRTPLSPAALAEYGVELGTALRVRGGGGGAGARGAHLE